MADQAEPLIRLEPGGKASVLRYDVSEPTSYPGRNFIELDLLEDNEQPEDVFLPKAFEKPGPKERPPLRDLDRAATIPAVMAAMRSGFSDPSIFPNVRLTGTVLRLTESPNPRPALTSSAPLSTELASLDPESVADALQAGKRLNIYKSLFGSLTYCYIDEPKKVDPGIYLVESYRLSSFLGDYGAGRILETLSLLPGEKTTLSLKTFRKTQTQAKQASSILDSFTEESAQEFERSIQEEQSDKQQYAKTFEYHAEAEASASWGWGSADVSGGVKGSTNSSREEFAKNVSSSTSKHAARASAKRDVTVNTSYEVTEETGEETSIIREIENINLSRTLNFIFRQMNQEFFTLLHLVDVRVAFFNGFAESRREVALPQLDSLLEEYVVEGKRQRFRDAVTDALSSIFDFQGNVVTDLVRTRTVGADQYMAVDTDKESTFKDGDREITVPGIIVSANQSVMRTEGVIVEAMLGQADALDDYAKRLQELEVRRRDAEVGRERALAERDALLNTVVNDGDADRAKLLEDLTCPCGLEQSAVHIHVGPPHPEAEPGSGHPGGQPTPTEP
jgi:hypothetical protein